MPDGNSARSARSRTQVGATNRCSTLLPTCTPDIFRENEERGASGTRARKASRAGAIRPRATSAAATAAAAAAAVDSPSCMTPLRSSRSHDLVRFDASGRRALVPPAVPRVVCCQLFLFKGCVE